MDVVGAGALLSQFPAGEHRVLEVVRSSPKKGRETALHMRAGASHHWSEICESWALCPVQQRGLLRLVSSRDWAEELRGQLPCQGLSSGWALPALQLSHSGYTCSHGTLTC